MDIGQASRDREKATLLKTSSAMIMLLMILIMLLMVHDMCQTGSDPDDHCNHPFLIIIIMLILLIMLILMVSSA